MYCAFSTVPFISNSYRIQEEGEDLQFLEGKMQLRSTIVFSYWAPPARAV